MKVFGPLHSLIVSGKFGNVVFQKNGTARTHFIPANPQTVAQMDQRQKVAVSGRAVSVLGPTVRANVKISDLLKRSPLRFWSARFMTAVRREINLGALTIFAALSGTDQTAWETEGDNLSLAAIVLPNTTIAQISPGQSMFCTAKALYRNNVAANPGEPVGTNSNSWATYISS